MPYLMNACWVNDQKKGSFRAAPVHNYIINNPSLLWFRDIAGKTTALQRLLKAIGCLIILYSSVSREH